jgi:hypothetical protein
MYSAIQLDEKSHLALVAWADKNIKVNGVRLPILVRDNGWKMFCHHMTIQYPGTPEFIKQYVGTEQKLDVTHLGIGEKAIAVRVAGFHSNNKIPHVTVAVNVRDGGKPVMSNQILNWVPVENGPKLKGTVTELN